MKKINFEVLNYLIFSLITLISIISFVVVYYAFKDWEKVSIIITGIAGCTTGGWLVFTMIFVPTFSSFSLFENQRNGKIKRGVL
ncbi:hypothetical protein OPB01_002546 [Salmonella enterica]|nr:hypothetical protein [Salmonella enterica]